MNNLDTLFADIETHLRAGHPGPAVISDHETPRAELLKQYERSETVYSPRVRLFWWVVAALFCTGSWYLGWLAFEYFLRVR